MALNKIPTLPQLEKWVKNTATAYDTELLDGKPPGKYKSGTTEKNTAKTFAESDVSVTTDKTQVASKSVEITGPEESLGTNATNTTTGSLTEAGMVINPDAEVIEVTVNLDYDAAQDLGSVEEVRLEDLSTSSVIAQKGVSLSPGDSITLTGLSLSAGTDYAIYLYDSDGVTSTNIMDPSVPKDGNTFDIIEGWEDGAKTTTEWAWTNITCQTVGNNGTAWVEWPSPSYNYAWKGALFQRTLDNETVDVYIEENQSGTWTEIAGPIQRMDEITADPANNVRFRVELSRADTANNPTLDLLALQWEI